MIRLKDLILEKKKLKMKNLNKKIKRYLDVMASSYNSSKK